MAKYRLGAQVTISLFAEVEAESEEEAREKAEELSMPSLCYGCTRQWEDEECWGLDELDGEACEITVEDE